MSKKRIFIILSILVIIIGSFYLFIRFKLSNKELTEYIFPNVEIANVKLVNITDKHINLIAYFTVNNPAPIGITIDSIRYIVHIGGKKILNSTYTHSVHLSASGQSKIDVPLTLYYKNMQAIVNRLQREHKDSITHVFDITLYSNLFPGKAFHIERVSELPFLYIPDIKILKTKIAKIDIQGITLDLKALIGNKNNFSFTCKNISYQLKFENHKAMKGFIPGKVILSAKDSTLVNIPLKINFNETEKSLIDLIRKGKHFRYDITLHVQLETSNHSLNGSKVIIEASGEWKKLRKALKN